MAEEGRPLPTLDVETRPFWEACKRHELLVQRCNDCGKFQYYPRAVCCHCLSTNLEYRKASGKGKVYTYSVVYINRAPGWDDKTPYVVAYVELEEGVRMMTNIVGCDPETVKIDMPVEVTFEDLSEEVALPVFKPAS